MTIEAGSLSRREESGPVIEATGRIPPPPPPAVVEENEEIATFGNVHGSGETLATGES